jgi:hypothetical protein
MFPTVPSGRTSFGRYLREGAANRDGLVVQAEGRVHVVISCSGLSVLRVPLFALKISVAAIHLEVTLDQFVSVSLEVLSDGRALPLNDEQLGLEPFEIKTPKCLQFVALDIHRQEVHFGDPLAIEKVVQCGLRN